MPKGARIAIEVVAGVVVAVLLLGAGFFFGMSPELGGKLQNMVPSGCSASAATPSDLTLQEEIMQELQSHYYKAIDTNALSVDAINGMVAGLGDPYTVYMDPQQYADFSRSTSGSYTGVGMEVVLKNSLVTVMSTFEDSPAQLAGIKAGDIVVSVDGVSTTGQTLQQVVNRLLGTAGTTVVVEAYRPSASSTTTASTESTTTTTAAQSSSTTAATVDVSQLPSGGTTTKYTLVRRKIAIPVTDMKTLQTTDGKKVAYISFYSFSSGSGKALQAEVQQAVSVDHDAAIILDLRENGGGLLDEAVNVASIFIPSGKIVSDKGLNSPERVYSATGGAFTQVPLYVLTDGFTASASEIVSGALQDYGRAMLIGSTTFGKGLVQTILPLSNGGALKVTTAVYLTPKGRDINKKGITPDVVAPDDPATANVDETVQAALGLIAAGKTAQPAQ